jgi:hypothetical protein
MKKTYIIPEIEIVEIAVQQMLATSINLNNNPVDPGQADAPDMLQDMLGLPALPGVTLF